LTLNWISSIRTYCSFKSKGLNLIAVKYEDLISDPRKLLSALFQYCDVPLDYIEKALETLIYDPQKGSVYQKQDGVEICSSSELAAIDHMLRINPAIPSPDFIVPGTLLH